MGRWITRGLVAAALVLGVGIGHATAQTNTSKIGVALTGSTLGGGIEVATPVLPKANVRVGFHTLTYDHTFNDTDVPIDAELKLQSFDVQFDWFVAGGFHISPGLTLYNGNKVSGTTLLANGKKLTLNDVDYVAAPGSQVTGSASVDFGNFGPSLRIGFGNLIPRGSRHWSIPFEIGVIYTSAPTFHLDLNGRVCPANTPNCATPKDIATDPTVSANLQKQRDQTNSDLNPLKAWPVISLGFSYKF
jgi:hypothetical protein